MSWTAAAVSMESVFQLIQTVNTYEILRDTHTICGKKMLVERGKGIVFHLIGWLFNGSEWINPVFQGSIFIHRWHQTSVLRIFPSFPPPSESSTARVPPFFLSFTHQWSGAGAGAGHTVASVRDCLVLAKRMQKSQTAESANDLALSLPQCPTLSLPRAATNFFSIFCSVYVTLRKDIERKRERD